MVRVIKMSALLTTYSFLSLLFLSALEQTSNRIWERFGQTSMYLSQSGSCEAVGKVQLVNLLRVVGIEMSEILKEKIACYK